MQGVDPCSDGYRVSLPSPGWKTHQEPLSSNSAYAKAPDRSELQPSIHKAVNVTSWNCCRGGGGGGLAAGIKGAGIDAELGALVVEIGAVFDVFVAAATGAAADEGAVTDAGVTVTELGVGIVAGAGAGADVFVCFAIASFNVAGAGAVAAPFRLALAGAVAVLFAWAGSESAPDTLFFL